MMFLWLSRTHNLTLLKEWRSICPEFFANLRIVLDTEAIAATRRFVYAQRARQPSDLADMVLEEMEDLDGIDHICVVNELDRKLASEGLTTAGWHSNIHPWPFSLRSAHAARASRKPPISSSPGRIHSQTARMPTV